MQTIEAVYDGKVLHPSNPLTLEPSTLVRLTIEIVQPAEEKTSSFLSVARSLALKGPPDWAENLDTCLYGGENG